MWSEILAGVNIQRSISLLYPEDGNSMYLRNAYYHVENLVHVFMSVCPYHSHVTVI